MLRGASGRALFAACAALLSAASAWADAYDLRIYQLGNPQQGGTGYSARADANFRSFARQLAAAIASVNLMAPDTLGHSGFGINAELSVVDFQGGPLPTEGNFRGPLLIPSLHLRKGLPWSFELGARAAWIEKSRMGAGTLEVRWAVTEGLAYLPDVALRASVTRLINGRDFELTTGGADLGIGKAFTIAGMLTLTPYVGWNLLFVGATSGTVDFRPSRSLVEADLPGEQYKDYTAFQPLQAPLNTHNRFYGGLRVVGGVVMLGAEVSYSVIGRYRDVGSGQDVDVPGVLAINGTLGLDF